MSKRFQLEIVSLESSIFSGQVAMVVVTGVMGELGILAGHLPLLTELKPGYIRTTLDNNHEVYYVSGGILEVQPEIVTILADTIIRAADLDEKASLEARAGARGILVDKKSRTDFVGALTQIAQATAKLRTIQVSHRGDK